MKKEYKPITSKKLIEVLKKTKHRKIAKVLFEYKDKELQLDGIGQFHFVPDVIIRLK